MGDGGRGRILRICEDCGDMGELERLRRRVAPGEATPVKGIDGDGRNDTA